MIPMVSASDGFCQGFVEWVTYGLRCILQVENYIVADNDNSTAPGRRCGTAIVFMLAGEMSRMTLTFKLLDNYCFDLGTIISGTRLI